MKAKINKQIKNKIVGITGGAGAGKSALAKLLQAEGYTVFSADEIAREIVATGQPALAEIAALFGEAALKPDGQLNRAWVRTRMLEQPHLRQKLEAITHPKIRARASELAAAAFAKGVPLVFYEAPLLFEAKSAKKMDLVVCVHAPDETRIQRIMRRDHCDRASAERLLANQMSQTEKMALSDLLVENNGSESDLRAEALSLINKLEKKFKRANPGSRGNKKI